MIRPEEINSGTEMLYSGHPACSGCGSALAVRYLTRALGPDLVMVITASCWSILAGAPPATTLKCPILACPFPSAAAVGGGVKRGLELKGHHDTTVVVLAGDGGTFDIGMQALSGAAQRNEDIIFICYDNEAYMNTGMQTSSATPYGSHTNTAPFPRFKEGRKKDIMQVMAAHGIPYAATATIAFPEDMLRKLARAQKTRGFRFLHLLTPCPPGWGADTDMTIQLSRLAVESRLFPLYEISDGSTYEVNHRPAQPVVVDEYLRHQRRFRGLEQGQREALQQNIDREWEALLHKVDNNI